MSLLQRFPAATFALVLVAIVGFCAAERSVTLLVVAGTIAAVSWYVTEGPRGRVLPRWASNVLVLIISASVVFDVMSRQGDVFGVLGRFCTWLTLVKLYERRTARDHAHLMALSLLLMLVGCLKSAEFVFGIVMLIYVVLGLYVLLLHHLYAAHESASARREGVAPTAGLPLPATRPVVGRHAVGQFRAMTVLLGLAVILLSVGVFLAFPRHLGRNLFATDAIINPLGRTTGYAEDIDLLAGGRINDSRRPVFDLQLLDEQGRPLRLDEPLLLRGAVLDRYDRGAWTGGQRDRMRLRVDDGAPASLVRRRTDPDSGGRTVRQHFRFRTPSAHLFSLYLPTAIETDRSTAISFSRSVQLLNVAEDEPMLRECTITARLDADDNALRKDGVALPPRSPSSTFRNDAYRELAERVLAARGLPPGWERRRDMWTWTRAAAHAIADHLRTNYRYSLDRSDVVLGGLDPIDEFLFHSRRGHCEFFASAMAALCESVGVEARVVTGYVAYNYDDQEQVYRVTAGNAHAWTEVRVGRYQFLPIDASPTSNFAPVDAAGAPLTERIGWLYQQLEGSWSGSVIGYDEAAQQDLLSGLDRGWSQRFGAGLESLREWADGINRRFNLGPAGYIWLGTVLLALLLAVVAALTYYHRARLLRRLYRFRRRRAVRVPWGLGFYLDMQSVLRRAGRIRPVWQTPLAFADSIAAQRAEAGAIVRRVTETYYEARFGGRALRPDEISRAKAMVQDLRRALGVRA